MLRNLKQSFYLAFIFVFMFIFFMNLPVGLAAQPESEKLVLEANKLCEEGKYNDAVIIYKQALTEYNSAHAAYNLGVTYEVNIRDMKQAVYYYQLFLSLEADSDDSRQVKGIIKNIKAAYPEIFVPKKDIIVQKKTPPPAVVNKTKKHKKAKKVNSLDDLDPETRKSAVIRLRNGQIFYKQARYKEAVDEYLEVLKIYNSADACYNLGVIYDRRLNFKKLALEYYKKFIQLAPDSPDTKRVQEWIEQANRSLASEKD